MAKNNFVVTFNEDGELKLYGPFSNKKATRVLRDIEIHDYSGNTEIFVRAVDHYTFQKDTTDV